MTRAAEGRFLRSLFLLLSGPLIWTAHFGASYAFATLAVTLGFDDWRVAGLGIIAAFVLAATLLAMAAIGFALALVRRAFGRLRSSAALAAMTVMLAGVSLIGVLLDALPVVLLSP